MFDARRDVRTSLQAMTVLVSGLEADRERLTAAVADPFLLATDVAEDLVRGGVPFRDAHEQVAASVRDGSYSSGTTAAESVAAPGRPGPGGVRRGDHRRAEALRRGPLSGAAPACDARHLRRRISDGNPIRRDDTHETHRTRRGPPARRRRARQGLLPRGSFCRRPARHGDTVTVSGTGSVIAVPDRAEVSAGVETGRHGESSALRQRRRDAEGPRRARGARGGKDVTTQTVSLSTSVDDKGQPNGFVASNVASAETTLAGAGGAHRRRGRRGREHDLRALALALGCGRPLPPGAREGRCRTRGTAPRSSRRPPAASSAASPR